MHADLKRGLSQVQEDDAVLLRHRASAAAFAWAAPAKLMRERIFVHLLDEAGTPSI